MYVAAGVAAAPLRCRAWVSGGAAGAAEAAAARRGTGPAAALSRPGSGTKGLQLGLEIPGDAALVGQGF